MSYALYKHFSRRTDACPAAVRHGFSLIWLPVSVVAVSVVAAIAYPMLGRSGGEQGDQPMVHTVARGTFTHDVTEPGELESSSNVEVRCEVKGRNSTGTMILEIVPAGTLVEPGQFLVKFDSSALEAERTQQQIICNTSQALMIQSKNVYETALITQDEYLQGTFKQEEQTIQSEVFVAEENQRRAKEYLQYSQRLAAKGYVTALQVEADRFAVEKASKELETAQTKLKVLQDFTRPKLLKQHEADVQTAKAKMQADENTHRLDMEKLSEIDQQIAKCHVVAPAAGKVVYANEVDGRGNAEIVIEEGTVVRERQPVIRLPDMTKMQVKAKVDESRIGYIQPGLSATVRLDSAPDIQLQGEVTMVDEYPMPRSWMSSSVKQYATYVEIFDFHSAMRPGMTSQVTIQIDSIQDALMIPVQAVFERSRNRYCIVSSEKGLQLRRIARGPINHSFVLVPESNLVAGEETLVEGERVVLNPSAYLERFELPEEPEQGPQEARGQKGGAGKGSDAAGTPKNRGSLQGPGGLTDDSQAGRPGASSERQSPGQKFQAQDKNSDGKLTEDELPPPARGSFSQVDANGDGGIDRGEFMGAASRRRPEDPSGSAGPERPADGPSAGGPGKGAP